MELLFGNEAIQWIQQFFGPGHPLPFRILSLFGDTWGMILVAGLTLWLFGRERLYAVVGIIVVGALSKEMLSNIFSHERPDASGILVYEHLEISSFPSGHVYEAVGPWGLLWMMGCVPLWLAAAIALGVALGRIYLGTHYLGDVLGGIAFAVPLVWIFARVWPSIRRWIGRLPRAVHTGAVLALLLAAAGWLLFVGGTPRRYEIVGMTIGGSLALLLLSREIFADSPASSARDGMLRGVIGAAGIVAMLLLDRSAPDDARLFGTLTAGAATLWALLAAPAAFRRLGRERQGVRSTERLRSRRADEWMSRVSEAERHSRRSSREMPGRLRRGSP